MIEINNKTRSSIDLKLVKKVCEEFLKYNNIENKIVSIGFVGDVIIKKINNKYRKINKITDILSFQADKEDNKYLGELIINYAQIKKQAKIFSNNIKDELIFILIHGLLHLLGYEDKTEKGRIQMEKLGNKFINFYDKNKKII